MEVMLMSRAILPTPPWEPSAKVRPVTSRNRSEGTIAGVALVSALAALIVIVVFNCCFPRLRRRWLGARPTAEHDRILPVG